MSNKKSDKLLELITSPISLDPSNDRRKETRKKILDHLDRLKEIISDGRLISLMIQCENDPKNLAEEDQETSMIFWNQEESVDVAIGKAARFQTRLVLMAEDLILDDY
jgi:hypothetical protein